MQCEARLDVRMGVRGDATQLLQRAGILEVRGFFSFGGAIIGKRSFLKTNIRRVVQNIPFPQPCVPLFSRRFSSGLSLLMIIYITALIAYRSTGEGTPPEHVLIA